MTGRKVVKIIRDPIHEYISIYGDEVPLLDSALLQRLRNVRQNGMAYFVYPALTVSRFEHSLGVMHLADQMLSSALARSDPAVTDEFLSRCSKEFGINEGKGNIEARLSRIIRIVALLHDLGQLPFSHTFEELIHQLIERVLPSSLMQKWQEYITVTEGSLHEFLTVLLLELDSEISEVIDKDKEIVLRILQAPPEDKTIFGTLHEIVSFDIDADRGDYLLRDGRASGAEFGRFDLRRLVEGMRLAKLITFDAKKEESFVIRPTIQALSAVESLIIERYKAYRWLYHHHRVVVTNRMLEEIIWRLLGYHWDNVSPFNTIPFSFPLTAVSSDENDIPRLFMDDVDVNSLLRQAYSLIKSNKIDQGIGSSDLWVEFQELKALLEEILFRRKRGVALWKDIGVYKQFNDKVANEIETIFREHQQQKYRRTEGRVLPAQQIHKTTDQTDFTLNWLVDHLLGRSFTKRKELERQINRELKGKKIPGFLLLSVTFFKPWEYRGEREYEVIGRDGDLYHISDVSPIVRQLKETNKSNIRLYAYLLLHKDIQNLSLSKQKDRMEEIRDHTKEVLAQNLMKWAKKQLSKEATR
jgi:HD superfamily phosphohydrolase